MTQEPPKTFEIGSSMFHAACGWKVPDTKDELQFSGSRRAYFNELTGRKERKFSDFALAMFEEGNRREPYIVNGACAVMGTFFRNTGDNQKSYRFTDNNGIIYRSTPDGSDFILGKNGEPMPIGLEVKKETDNRKVPRTPFTDMPQIQGQCWICNFAGVIYGVESAKGEQRFYKVFRSNAFIKELIKSLGVFADYLLKDEIPPPWGCDAAPVPVYPKVQYVEIER